MTYTKYVFIVCVSTHIHIQNYHICLYVLGDDAKCISNVGHSKEKKKNGLLRFYCVFEMLYIGELNSSLSRHYKAVSSPFAGENPEVQRGEIICPRSQNEQAAKPESEHKCLALPSVCSDAGMGCPVEAPLPASVTSLAHFSIFISKPGLQTSLLNPQLQISLILLYFRLINLLIIQTFTHQLVCNSNLLHFRGRVCIVCILLRIPRGHGRSGGGRFGESIFKNPDAFLRHLKC